MASSKLLSDRVSLANFKCHSLDKKNRVYYLMYCIKQKNSAHRVTLIRYIGRRASLLPLYRSPSIFDSGFFISVCWEASRKDRNIDIVVHNNTARLCLLSVLGPKFRISALSAIPPSLSAAIRLITTIFRETKTGGEKKRSRVSLNENRMTVIKTLQLLFFSHPSSMLFKMSELPI